jgi:hypothetical protein
VTASQYATQAPARHTYGAHGELVPSAATIDELSPLQVVPIA